MSRFSIAVLPVAVCAFCVWAAEPSFRLTFDESFDGTGAAGRIAAHVEGTPRLVPGGISGQAMLTGPDHGFITVPTEGILSPREGTIMMWIKPLDWETLDHKDHVFAETRVDRDWILLYKHGLHGSIMAATEATGDGMMRVARYRDAGWRTGQWQHIAMTWGPAGVCAWVNGKTYEDLYPLPGPMPRQLGRTIAIGDRPWASQRHTSTQIDEVKFFTRALTSNEVFAEYNADRYHGRIPFSNATSRFRLAADGRAGTVEFILETGGAPIPPGTTVCFSWCREGAERKTVPIVDGVARAVFPLPAQGNHAACAEVRVDGKLLFEFNDTIEIPDLSWRGNRIGLERTVLPGFEPLKVEGEALSCYGRQYTFASSPLPTSIRSAAGELLAAPVTLVATIDGHPVRWQGTVRLPAETDGYDARFSGTLAGDGVELQVEGEAGFDGLVRFEVRGAAAEKLETLALELRLDPHEARFFHRSADFFAVTRRIPATSGLCEKTAFLPFYWLGNDNRGLFWCCDTDRGWPNGTAPDACTIRREADAVVFTVQLLQKGQRLSPDWEFQFALQGTPVKALDPALMRRTRPLYAPGIREKTADSQHRILRYIMWSVPKRNPYAGYPEIYSWFNFKDWIGRYHSMGSIAQNYQLVSCLDIYAPEFRLFGKYWKMGYTDLEILPNTGNREPNGVLAAVAYGAPDYADFVVWKTRKLLRDYPIDGIYLDNVFPYDSYSEQTPYGYVRDGHRRKGYSVLDGRSLYRRLFTMVAQERRESLNECHVSNKMCIPLIEWFDAFLTGENVAHKAVDGSYAKTIPTDVFRFEYSGRPWGVAAHFAPYLAIDTQKPGPTRELMALLMLHDTALYMPDRNRQYVNMDEVNRALDALDEFGYVEAEFTPYFDAECAVRANGMEKVYASTYRRAGGAVLAIVGNLSGEARQGTLSIDAARLGFQSPVATDFLTGEELPGGTSVPVAVPAQDYRLLLIQDKP